MLVIRKTAIISFLTAFVFVNADAQKNNGVNVWLTDPAGSMFFTKQLSPGSFHKKATTGNSVITVDDTQKYQSIDGFGFALTGGSAMNIIRMSAASRFALLKELVATDKNNIGASYLRVSIGAADLNDHVFSYDDLPAGKTDTGMLTFNLGPAKQDVIPGLDIRRSTTFS